MAKKSNDQPHWVKSNAPSRPRAEEEYKVGPGHPPREHQFKPGRSGNPKGAKRKPPSLVPDLKRIFEQALNQKVTVAQGERQQVITMWAAGMRQLAIQFAKGDRHARHDVFWIAEQLGSEFLTPQKAFEGMLAPDLQAILDAYVARRTSPKSADSASRVLAPPELLDDDKPDRE